MQFLHTSAGDLTTIHLCIVIDGMPKPKKLLPLRRELGNIQSLKIHMKGHANFGRKIFDNIVVNKYEEPEVIQSCSPNTRPFSEYIHKCPPEEGILKISLEHDSDSSKFKSTDCCKYPMKKYNKRSEYRELQPTKERKQSSSPQYKPKESRQRRKSRSLSCSSRNKRQSRSQSTSYVPEKRARSPYLQQDEYISRRRPRKEHSTRMKSKTPELPPRGYIKRKRSRTRSQSPHKKLRRGSRSYSPKLNANENRSSAGLSSSSSNHRERGQNFNHPPNPYELSFYNEFTYKDFFPRFPPQMLVPNVQYFPYSAYPSVRPPIAQPPIARPPIARPPIARPPVAQPQIARPPVAQPQQIDDNRVVRLVNPAPAVDIPSNNNENFQEPDSSTN